MEMRLELMTNLLEHQSAKIPKACLGVSRAFSVIRRVDHSPSKYEIIDTHWVSVCITYLNQRLSVWAVHEVRIH
jgi:hypothetical protein